MNLLANSDHSSIPLAKASSLMKHSSCCCSWTFVFLLSAAATLTGCGEAKGPKTATVSGKVTLDGTPLADGSINFLPVDGVGVPAGGKITNGAYTVTVPLGDKRVEIRAPKVVGQKDAYEGDPKSPKIDLIEERIPARYNANSDLKTNVASDKKNEASFTLETPKS